MKVIKEFIKKVATNTNMGFSLLFKEILPTRSKMKGEFFITLNHNDGRVEEVYKRNVIVDSSSLLIARLLADGQTTIDPTGPAHGLWVLAVGTGDISWDKQNPPAPTHTQEHLESELARKKFATVTFIRTDGSGLPASEVTSILDFKTQFNESEAVGPLVEFGLYGGDADETIADSGSLINYLTFPVINKPATATLSVIFRITC